MAENMAEHNLEDAVEGTADHAQPAVAENADQLVQEESAESASAAVEGSSQESNAKKRRRFTSVVWASLIALVLVGCLFAYLTAMADDANVMTAGNVDIEQIEQQLDADGELKAFSQEKPLYPGTSISKIVSVKNVGTSPAYFRTLIAFEDVPDSSTFDFTFTTSEQTEESYDSATGPYEAAVDGVHYRVYVFTHTHALAAGATSIASLASVGLASACTNADMVALGNTYEVVVVSQAGQVSGYEGYVEADSVRAALDKQFGAVDAKDNLEGWLQAALQPGSAIAES